MLAAIENCEENYNIALGLDEKLIAFLVALHAKNSQLINYIFFYIEKKKNN